MIEAKSLTMHYGSTRAVEDVSFTVEKGEILGLLGPNGAGKTTIMNILTAQIIPTSGTATVEGFDVLEEPLEVCKHTGYLPENVPLYMDMEVEEYLHFVGKGRRLTKTSLKERMEWVIERCGLKTMLKRIIFHLSKGYRQRVGLAQALIHDPQVLLLDEPTSGLDPLQIIEIRSLVKELSQEKTIIVSTHILQEVEAISDRIMIINEGRIIAKGAQKDLQQNVFRESHRVVTLKGDSEEIQKAFGGLPHVRGVKQLDLNEENELSSFRVLGEPGCEIWLELARVVQENGWLVKELREEKPTLEEAFIQLTRASKQSS